MPVNYIVLAIPVFFALIGLELLLTRVLERDSYSLADSLNDLSCGIVQQLVEVFAKTALFAGYAFLYGAVRAFDIPLNSAWAWVACFLGVDLCYYWFHRVSHRVNAVWATHVVHHQSEEYNLAVALRQGAFQGWFSWVFYLPLAVLGFPPLMFLTLTALDTLYQFWIHTRVIGKLGPLEWVLNTPSHHRVHHACNPKYIDRNYAGTLIIWDRMFGSFKEERDEPVYGITKPLRSWNPVWANLHVWADLFGKARRTSRLVDRLRLFWSAPGWQPADLGGFEPPPEVDRATYEKYRTPLPRGLALYVLVQFVLVLLGTTWLLFRQRELTLPLRSLGALAAVLSLAALGGLFERKAWAAAMEWARLALAPLAVWLATGEVTWTGLAAVVAAACALWLSRHARLFGSARAEARSAAVATGPADP
jgi:sterol desaturase/sphingolipid hydroxylase (fatty acid hydroxylase superfamily)